MNTALKLVCPFVFCSKEIHAPSRKDSNLKSEKKKNIIQIVDMLFFRIQSLFQGEVRKLLLLGRAHSHITLDEFLPVVNIISGLNSQRHP